MAHIQERPGIESSTSAELRFENVGLEAGGRSILRDVTMDAPSGRVLCLLGPSGSGKTTLLRIAAGLERQTSGRLVLAGRLLADRSRFVAPEHRGIGLMFQDFALFPHMTLLDNVRFGLKGLPASEARTAASAALDRVGLLRICDQFPHTLSGGEQQRVALARALAPRPRVLLMDEPFSGLDSRLKEDVRAETLRILRETGATAVVVTHDAEEAMGMADRIALLRDGRLVQAGTPRDLYRQPADLFTAGFFSRIDVVPGFVKAGQVVSPLGPVAHSPRSEGSLATIAIRAGGLRVRSHGAGARARVLARRFLGSADLVTLMVDGLEKPLHARVRPDELGSEVEDVVVSVDPQELFVFEQA